MAFPVIEGGVVGFVLALAFAFFRHYRALKTPISRVLRELGVEDESAAVQPEKQTTRELLETCAKQLLLMGAEVAEIADDVHHLTEEQTRQAAIVKENQQTIQALLEWRQGVDKTTQRQDADLKDLRALFGEHETRLARIETAVAMRGTDVALARAATRSLPLVDPPAGPADVAAPAPPISDPPAST